MRFKIGDKVRVKKDLEVDKDYGNYYVVVEDMKEYKGKEFIIHEVWRNCYRLKDIGYYWTDEMLEPVEEGEINNMNIEELNLEYKNKMDALMEEYKTKVKEVTKKEEPFIKEGQRYFVIDDTFELGSYCYTDDLWDKKYLNYGNIFPYTEENEEEVRKEVNLIAERKKLQSEMEMFARQNNNCEIDWNDGSQPKWCLWLNSNELQADYIYNCRELNTTYFTSAEVAEKALEKFGDRIRELYINAENNSKDSEQ